MTLALVDGPEGTSFKFRGKSYEIEPLVFGGASLKRIKRAMTLSDAEDVVPQLRKAGFPEVALRQLTFRYGFADIDKAVRSDPDAIAAGFSVACPQMRELGADESLKAARELIYSHHDPISIGLLMVTCSGVGEAGESGGARDVLQVEIQKRRERALEQLKEVTSSMAPETTPTEEKQEEPQKPEEDDGVQPGDSRKRASIL